MEEYIGHLFSITFAKFQTEWNSTLQLHTWSYPLALCWASGRLWASCNDPPPCPSASGCCPELFAPGSSTRTCLWGTRQKQRRWRGRHSNYSSLQTPTHTNTHTDRPISLASSSVSVLLRYVFFFFREFPEGRVAPVLGIGGSPSFCWRASAITRNARRPMFIRWKTDTAPVFMPVFQEQWKI